MDCNRENFHRSIMAVENKNGIDYPENFFSTSETINKIVGLGVFGNEKPMILRLSYLFYKILLLTTGLAFLACELYVFRDTISEPQKLLSQIGLFFTHFVGIGKLLVLVVKRDRLEDLKKLLQDPKYRYESFGDFRPGARMHLEKKIMSFICVFVFVLYSFVGVSAHVSSIVKMTGHTSGERFQGNVSCKGFMLYYFYIPFDAGTSSRCHLAFLYMDVALGIFAWYIATLDGLFVTLLNCLKTQMNILCQALATIRTRCLKKMGLPESLETLHDNDVPHLEDEMYKELTHCTKHLLSLLLARDEIETLFTFITLAQTLASLLIFASCLFVASSVPVTSPDFFAQVEYFCAVLTQLSIYCWFGNRITIAGESIVSAMYDCDWHSSSLRFKKSMILSMTRMQRPVYLSIGKFSPLTLATLVSVCRGSFSYFAVFQSVD